jgi:hypothetical protein
MKCMTGKPFTLTCAALLLLSGATTTAAADLASAATMQLGETNTAESGKTYIALGDSFSCGYNIKPFEEGTRTSSNDCQRSVHAYPHRIAENFGLDLSFHACTGVRTWSFFNDKAVEPNLGQLPQLEYLKEDASLVTFTVGGIDLGFLYAIVDCLWGYEEWEPGNDCNKELKVNILVQSRFDRLAGKTESPEYITQKCMPPKQCVTHCQLWTSGVFLNGH